MTTADIPSGTPWWIAAIMIATFGPPALGSQLMTRVPGWLGKYARYRERIRITREAAAQESAAERISRAEINRILADYERLRDARVDDRAEFMGQIAELRNTLAEVKASLTVSNQRMWAAIGDSRAHRSIVQEVAPHRLLPVPEKLKDIL